MRPAVSLGATVLAAVLSLAPLSIARASEPVELGAGYLLDESDVLTDAQEERLEAKLAALADKSDRPELYVVFVENFESPSNAGDWAARTATLNNLAPDQHLLAIATEGRSLALSFHTDSDLSLQRVQEIEEGLGSGYLADDDWAGGVEYVADEFDEVPLPWWVWVLGVLVLAALIWVVTQLVLRARRRAARAAELRTLEGQKKRAAVTLVRADEALRTSEQELGFVTAEFGDAATSEYQAVLTEGRAKLSRAFELQTLLQDVTEDSTAESRSWTDEILRLCGQVDRALDERRRRLAELRGVAKDAAATLERLTMARTEADALVRAAETHLQTLGSTVAPDRLAGIGDDPDEMRERLAHADEWLARLRDAAGRRSANEITTAVREIERDLAEVTQLHSAVAGFALAETPAAVATPAEASGPPLPSFARTTIEATGDREIDRVAAALRVAENSVSARAGRVTAGVLAKLSSAQNELALARTADDPETKSAHVRAALAMAEQVQGSLGERSTARIAAHGGDDGARRDGSWARPPRPSLSSLRSSRAADGDDMGAKAGVGAVVGGVMGVLLGANAAGGAGAIGGLLLGLVFGALTGAFGGEGGGSSGSSSGWGGSSSRSRSRSWSGGSSRSSSRSSGRHSSSGGRRF
ncbi:TPM domain-containing protein [Microbacterium stercoris]|uniref:TPM domain-containing protein n=1 Tax=Microbacterium stercoris TaxID=2820289 RepID=A0A939QI08_9MICO|nr:TPM domain-containing protein [Microbacterium stercoris]MBO3663213.1 TPM domain-containing protein [Microbacterium stercoris]